MIKSVSHIILQPTKNLNIKLMVNITDYKDGIDCYYSLYESIQGDYLTFNLNPRVIIQYKSDDKIWDPSKSICIDSGNILTWTRGINRFYKDIQNPDLFTYFDSGNIQCNHPDRYKKTIQLRHSGIVELIPTVLVDGSSIYPGISMSLNMKDNRVDMTFDEFESIVYKFQNFDMHGEALKLIILKELMENKVKKGGPGKPRTVEYIEPKKNIFQNYESRIKDSENEEVVQDKRVINNNTNNDLMNL